MRTPTPSAPALTERILALVDRIAKTLDELYPSVVISAPEAAPEPEPGDKPDFVRADDAGWTRIA